MSGTLSPVAATPGAARLPGRWPRVSSPAAPASSARTSATSCCVAATASSASTTSRPARWPTSSTSAGRSSTFLPGRHHRAVLRRRARGLRLPPRLARVAHRLPAAAAAHAQGRLVRHAPHARPRQEAPRPLPDRLDQRGLRRPAGPPAARELLGPRQPDRPARRLRRGQALRRGADDGLPPPAGRGHGDHPDLQHVRPADAPARRPRDPDVPAPGARRTGRSPSSATAARPARSATSTTSSGA